MAISLKTHKMLWGRSGNRCCFPTCKKRLVEDETTTDDASVVGDEAHIVGRDENGPRGLSPLNSDDRDKFSNLMLLCKVHHKLIDDQENTYTVDALTHMKQNHFEWVEKNLDPDINRQKNEEVYASYFDRWSVLAAVPNWQAWTSFIFGGGDPQVTTKQLQNLVGLNNYLLGRVWPKLYDRVEFAFGNFRLVLNDFLNVFAKYSESSSDEEETWRYTKKFYKIPEWNPERYSQLSVKHDFHVDLVQDLACEMTRAANYLSDQVRIYISSAYRIHEGVLLIETGPDLNLKWTTVRLEYNSTDIELISYPGLRKFMESRNERGYYFGNGVSEDYFPTDLY